MDNKDQVEYTGNGTAGREADVQPTGFFFQMPKQEPELLAWDEVFDAAASAYCRSEASRKALRLCFQTRQQTTQVSIGWTANELMAFAKTVAYICATEPQRNWQGLTDDEVQEFLDNRAMSEWCGAGHVHLLPYTFARAIETKLKEKNT